MTKTSKARMIKCPYLTRIVCSACEGPYLPSPFELDEYCRSSEHRKCPFYSGLAKYTRTWSAKN